MLATAERRRYILFTVLFTSFRMYVYKYVLLQVDPEHFIKKEYSISNIRIFFTLLY